MHLSLDTEKRRYDWLAGNLKRDVITVVRKANVCPVHDNCTTEARFLRESHDASGNPSLKKIVRDTYD